jgi:hypothetical protein
MPEYTVQFASVKKEIPDGTYGPAIVYSLVLDDGSAGFERSGVVHESNHADRRCRETSLKGP